MPLLDETISDAPNLSHVSNTPKNQRPCTVTSDTTHLRTPEDHIEHPIKYQERRKATRNKMIKSAKSKLFGQSQRNSNIESRCFEEAVDLLPHVLDRLANVGLVDDFVSLLKVISDGRMPATNISLRLVFDTESSFLEFFQLFGVGYTTRVPDCGAICEV